MYFIFLNFMFRYSDVQCLYNDNCLILALVSSVWHLLQIKGRRVNITGDSLTQWGRELQRIGEPLKKS